MYDADIGDEYSDGLSLRARGCALTMKLLAGKDLAGVAHSPENVAGVATEDGARYDGILPQVNSIVTVSAEAAEEWLEIASSEWTEMAWRLETRDLTIEEVRGTLVAVNATGHSIFRMGELSYQSSALEHGVAEWSWSESEGLLRVRVPRFSGTLLLDPMWSATGSMNTARHSQSATLIPDEGVLVVGGYNSATGLTLSSCEIFDLSSGTWTAATPVATPRRDHNAVLLDNGKLLIAGGMEGKAVPGEFVFNTTCELFDPGTSSWSATGAMASGRFYATATVLADGRVLICGGVGTLTGFAVPTTEIFDPATGLWTGGPPMTSPRYLPAAARLTDGRVLVTGGDAGDLTGPGHIPLATCEVYNPVTNAWTATGSFSLIDRVIHTSSVLSDGRVLVSGGAGSAHTATCEVYDPAFGTWTATGSMSTTRNGHTATTLPDGRVLVVAGEGVGGYRDSCEIYDPAAGTWSGTVSLIPPVRNSHRAILLPTGRVLVSGGATTGGVSLASCQIYDPELSQTAPTPPPGVIRANHAQCMLPDGRILVTGGDGGGGPMTGCQTYNPFSDTWSGAASMGTPRSHHSAVLLADGRVLASGGYDGAGASSSAEIYDPAGNVWTPVPGMILGRFDQRAILLPDDRILLVGGATGTPAAPVPHAESQIYDPVKKSWAATGSMAVPRMNQGTTLLPDRTVLVSGGDSGGGETATCERYDYVTGLWTPTTALPAPRQGHSATILADRSVLVAGGTSAGAPLATAERFDATTSTWSATGGLGTGRADHEALVLPTGMVLATGGTGAGGATLASNELYDPANGSWRDTTPLPEPRVDHRTTLLPTGEVLITNGNSGVPLGSAIRYDWTTAAAAAAPVVAAVNGSAAPLVTVPYDSNVGVDGAQLMSGFLAAQYGWTAAAENTPHVAIVGPDRLWGGGQPRGWGDQVSMNFDAPPRTNYYDHPQGHYLMFVIANGIVADARVLHLVTLGAAADPNAWAWKSKGGGGCFVASAGSGSPTFTWLLAPLVALAAAGCGLRWWRRRFPHRHRA